MKKSKLLIALQVILASFRFVIFASMYWDMFVSTERISCCGMAFAHLGLFMIDFPFGLIEFAAYWFSLDSWTFYLFGFQVAPVFILLMGIGGTLWWYFIPQTLLAVVRLYPIMRSRLLKGKPDAIILAALAAAAWWFFVCQFIEFGFCFFLLSMILFVLIDRFFHSKWNSA